MKAPNWLKKAYGRVTQVASDAMFKFELHQRMANGCEHSADALEKGTCKEDFRAQQLARYQAEMKARAAKNFPQHR